MRKGRTNHKKKIHQKNGIAKSKQIVPKKFFTESFPYLNNKKNINGTISHQIKINNNIELILFDRKS